MAGPSQFPPPIPPVIPVPTHSSILDEPILTDEDLAILTQGLLAEGINEDADGEVDLVEEQSVVEIEVGADKGKGKEKEVDKLVIRVLKSSPVRFFCLFWAQPDHSRSFYFPKIIGPQPNPYQPVACGCMHQLRPVVTSCDQL